ncbi:phage repressor protein CI [Candidatus Erwinia dacicola]|uniref:Repressor n=1 Tax=Candidatus Erwinia dacicola TaxID=252393 RepID=A0A1E7YVZ8_9GAMM|nr:phage repressor protein CI [Candidatus Erwinia dacicola]NJD00751.1 phage repressor protein CI [Candidatus Erwinia dacicola]OFC60707.1 repressor [Candidatus Erwinia dacicola]RAP70060.1 bacteriophage CI repressor helix-turn-helix domain protein [Candidatus Erwinia dacicola]
MNLQINFTQGGGTVLDRVIEAYGFSTKLALADHLGIASSSLANRYKRDFFPADVVVRCMAETGATLEWLVTGQGLKHSDGELDVMSFPRYKIVDGQLLDDGIFMLDKNAFLPGKALPKEPISVLEGSTHYIIDKDFGEIYDNSWLIEIEGKTSVRVLTRIPVKKVRVSGVGPGASFDCSLDEINIIGRVALTIN